MGSLRWVILVIYLGNHNPSKNWTSLLLLDIEHFFYMLDYLTTVKSPHSPISHAVPGSTGHGVMVGEVQAVPRPPRARRDCDFKLQIAHKPLLEGARYSPV